jgi:hypothetical protein
MPCNEVHYTCDVCKEAGRVQTTIHYCDGPDEKMTKKKVIARMKQQASLCQADMHYVWAAILYRRVGDEMMATYCEMLAESNARSSVPEFLREKAFVVE